MGTAIRRKFHVYLKGSMHAFTLYDEKGGDIFALDIAAGEAERQFPGEWREIANGMEGITREEWDTMRVGHDH